MSDSPKYLVHAAFRANGVVERNDVVGAVFGQTEGLLGEDLDLRDLQQSSKVGRIDVALDTEAGRTYGTVTIASGLDRVETAILAAALETIERVGPARARFEVDSIEDAREAKRREVVDRATELLADLEATSTTSHDLVEAVREQVRVADIAEYEGLPAGPRVEDSDAIVIVEGRADVLTLLRYGVRNAIAAEGTDVPEALAELSEERTATAFLDGDRGGELICRELAQVAALDYVTFAPEGLAVEDLDRAGVVDALRRKVPIDAVVDAPSTRAAFYELPATEAGSSQGDATGAGGSSTPDAGGSSTTEAGREGSTTTTSPGADADAAEEPVVASANGGTGSATADRSDSSGSTREAGSAVEPAGDPQPAAVQAGTGESAARAAESEGSEAPAEPDQAAESRPETLPGHVAAVIGQGTESVRLLDPNFAVLETGPADEPVATLEAAEPVPETVVLDGVMTQAVLDVAAQRGVGQVIARQEGEFVKRPTDVRTRTADEF